MARTPQCQVHARHEDKQTAMDVGLVGKVKSGGKGSKGAGKRNNQTQQICSRCGNTDHISASNCLHSDKRAENVERLVIWQVCVDLLGLLSPRARAVRTAREVAKVRMLPRLVGIVVRVDTCRRSVPGRRSMRWKNPPLRARRAAKTQSWLDRSEATSMLAA